MRVLEVQWSWALSLVCAFEEVWFIGGCVLDCGGVSCDPALDLTSRSASSTPKLTKFEIQISPPLQSKHGSALRGL